MGDRPTSIEEWRAHRSRLDATVWADEKKAGEYEKTLVALWDALLDSDRREAGTEKANILSEVGLGQISFGTPRSPESLDHGIQRVDFAAPIRRLDAAQWTAYLNGWNDAGYRLVQSEWHHASFDPPTTEAPARSLVAVVLHIQSPTRDRIVIEGELGVEWSAQADAKGLFLPERVDATGLEMFTRSGPLPFERIFSVRSPRRPDAYAGIHPLLLYDLDRDGRPDVVMVRAGRVLWNRDGGFEMKRLIDEPHLLTEAAVIADFDGDGFADLLASRARGDLALYPGDEAGSFADASGFTEFAEPLRGPSAITAGDIDADGDLDVWLAQYKPAYSEGQMPSPFFDANDGYASHLLLNDGTGQFQAATAGSGLASKRFRRTYSTSLVDLDEDGDLDLVVVSDYAGVDLYTNDGTGHFSDAEHLMQGDRHLFGMSAAFADYDLDGRLDIFAAGMGSTTARRLEEMGLARSDRPEVGEMRMRMGYGNRLYVSRGDGYQESEFAAEVARTGWTWGTTAFDFDNDGDPDLFAANGHQSGESTEDYCSNFWSHDVYDGVSEPDPALANLFSEASVGLRTGRASWDGYQKNHLLMNREGRGFVDVAFLLGVADQFDSRSALSTDLDRDGRVDLLVTEDLGTDGEKLHIYRNTIEPSHSFIGIDFVEQGTGTSPIGAAVTVRTRTRTHVGRVVTGDSLMGQHAATLHFGLGDEHEVESIDVRWPNGATRSLLNPEIDRYHLVLAPSGTGIPEVLDSSVRLSVDALAGKALFDALLAEAPEEMNPKMQMPAVESATR